MIPAFKADIYGATESPLPHQMSSNFKILVIINLQVKLTSVSDA